MRKGNVLGLLLALCVMGGAYAGDKTNENKVGVNMLSMLLLGDMNASYEHFVTQNISLVTSAHFVSSSKYVTAEGEGYRFTGGARAYGTIETWDNAFFELKMGVSHYTDSTGETLTGRGAPLSLEFYGGSSNRFNDFLFYEMKLGLIRFIRTGNVVPGAGFSVGIHF